MNDTTKQIIRVFPRRTKATPTDELAFVGDPPLFRPDPETVDRVDVSVAFTWDISEARRLANSWSRFYRPVRIGGPAFDDPGGEFIPGRYLKPGYVITSRGCPRHCPKCLVPAREGPIRTLTIRDGYNVVDNNLLACPRSHVEAVMEMLKGQSRGAEFTGGIDARLITDWWIESVAGMNVRLLFLAYDSPEDLAFVCAAVTVLRYRGLERRRLGCYVLCGYEGDTPKAAETRCRDVWMWGAVPFAMYYRPATERTKDKPPEWAAFVRLWIRRPEIYSRMEKQDPEHPEAPETTK